LRFPSISEAISDDFPSFSSRIIGIVKVGVPGTLLADEEDECEYARDGMDEIEGIESVGLVDVVGLLPATRSGNGKLCLGSMT
jgi:hypothetical protein